MRCLLVAAGLYGSPAPCSDWHQEAFRIKVGGVALDIANEALGSYFESEDGGSTDAFGHAAPFLADLDDDGRRDLVVGSYSGRFRFYRNIGAGPEPAFSRNFVWLTAGGEPALVNISCCVASGPQMIDIDGDGILDLTSGSYDPGAVYWFRGRGGVDFDQRHMLTDWSGIPVFSHPEAMQGDRGASFMSNIAWTDWNDDGLGDLLIGSFTGELFVRFGRERMTPGYTALRSQPVFQDKKSQARHIDQILVNGGKIIEEMHSAPGVADWDGDGLWDILMGTDTGAVYWFRNTGVRGSPEFRSRQQLIGPGEGVEQWVEPGQSPRRGIRSQIHAVDYNRDGGLDLLVGDWSYTMTPRANLTSKEKRELGALRRRLSALDRQVGFPHYNWRHKWRPYFEANKPLLRQAEALREQMAPYLENYETEGGSASSLKAHGHVWVFLRKPGPLQDE